MKITIELDENIVSDYITYNGEDDYDVPQLSEVFREEIKFGVINAVADYAFKKSMQEECKPFVENVVKELLNGNLINDYVDKYIENNIKEDKNSWNYSSYQDKIIERVKNVLNNRQYYLQREINNYIETSTQKNIDEIFKNTLESSNLAKYINTQKLIKDLATK